VRRKPVSCTFARLNASAVTVRHRYCCFNSYISLVVVVVLVVAYLLFLEGLTRHKRTLRTPRPTPLRASAYIYIYIHIHIYVYIYSPRRRRSRCNTRSAGGYLCLGIQLRRHTARRLRRCPRRQCVHISRCVGGSKETDSRGRTVAKG